jgi:hypothetical protein
VRKSDVVKKKIVRKDSVKPASGIAPQQKTFLDRTEVYLASRKNIFLFSSILLAVVLGLLQFNYRISEANDDSMYLEDAFKFSKDFFGYYTANAPFYPMFLSLFIRLFGFKLVILKLTGFLFMMAHLFFLYKAFEKRIPYLVLFFVLFFTAVNPYMLYYASMTFTEQFFMMQQAIFLFLFFKTYDRLDANNTILQRILLWLPVGLILFILTMSRNVAIGIIIPVVVFLLYERKFKDIFYFLLSFSVFRMPFEFLRKMLWGDTNQFSNQMNSLIRWKDPYDPSKGVEDFSGYIDRFASNFNLYINKRMLQIFGFMSESDTSTKAGFGFIVIILLVVSIFLILKKNKPILLFTLLYSGALICITFIAVQSRWDQLRLILVFVPLLLIVFFSVFTNLEKKSKMLNFFIVFIMIIFLFSTSISTSKSSISNFPVVKKNLSGDMYFGYTTDWINYLKLSAWCADSLPGNSLVACRKAPMSFIYGKGKEFFPVYQVFSNNPDTVINRFRSNGVTHVLLSSLRRNPIKQDGYIINTIHRLLQPVIEKYPGSLELIKTEGTSEQAYLYKINYDRINEANQ